MNTDWAQIQQLGTTPPAEKSLHVGVACSGCRARVIYGTRYKCTVCPGVNYCERCEKLTNHPKEHALLMIRVPLQEPTPLVRIGEIGPITWPQEESSK